MKALVKLKGIWKLSLPALVVLGIAVLAGIVLLLGFVVQWLWNTTVTAIFQTPAITWWQAVLMLVLCKLLFGNEYNVRIIREPGRHGEGEAGQRDPDQAIS
jgi:hypothetical protein